MKQLTLILISLLLTACSTFNADTSSPILENGKQLGTHHLPWPQRQAQLSALKNWSAQGSAAAHTDQKGWNAYYHWQQDNANYSLIMFGPLGMHRVQERASF